MSELSPDDKAVLAELLRDAIGANPPPPPQRVDQLAAILEKLEATGSTADAPPAEENKVKPGVMTLDDAYTLFHRLGVDVRALSREFRAAYVHLARCYHPDQDPTYHELMANINAARTTILNSLR